MRVSYRFYNGCFTQIGRASDNIYKCFHYESVKEYIKKRLNDAFKNSDIYSSIKYVTIVLYNHKRHKKVVIGGGSKYLGSYHIEFNEFIMKNRFTGDKYTWA